MLAYSSVEHMGILALGVGLGGAGAFGTALHAVNHSLTKAALFLTAGNILGAYGTKSIRDVKGVLRVLPASGVLWVAGMLSITGTPPFGTFLSEFTILKAGFDAGRGVVAVVYLGLLGIIFVGMSSLILGMAQGDPAEPAVPVREKGWSTGPPAALLLLSVGFGVYLPPILREVLAEMARSLGGQ
jgi:hydrogenase-4 component F